MASPMSGALAALVPLAVTLRAAALLEEPALGCLWWQGVGCDGVTDEHACLASRDGRPWRHWEGYDVAGEPCAWCGGKPCAEGGDALCAPRDWVRELPGVAVANCSAGFVTFPSAPLSGHGATKGVALADEFEEGGGEGFRCGAEYIEASKEFNDYYFKFTASSLEACKAICLEEDYCTGVEFVAEGLACRVWWHPISTVEPADGHSCARRAQKGGTDLTPISSNEARARADAAMKDEEEEEEEANAKARAAAIGGGVGGGVADAGLLAGMLRGLLGHSTETVTTTLQLGGGASATLAGNRALSDVASVESGISAGQWASLVCSGLLCAALALFLARSKAKVATRSVTLEHEEESPRALAEAGLPPPHLRWPAWARSPHREVGHEGRGEACEAMASLLVPPRWTEPMGRQAEPLGLPAEPVARAWAHAEVFS